jgi:hypothetical protein
MVKSFGTESPVLMYRLRAHADPGVPDERAWLLWPAWAFRIVAPEIRPRRINVLQRAVLGVLRASRLTAEEIGLRLGIHAELAAFVVAELQGEGRVDEAWNVTKAGVELLDEEQEEAANLVPGWVFRDPWTGNLWPFVATHLEHARAQYSPDGSPLLDFGTTGKPRRQRAWAQLPMADLEPVPPDAREILRAAVRHRRLERRADRLHLWREEIEPPLDLSRFDLDRLSTIETVPHPVFLVTYLYVPSDGSGGDWHACDFFGRGSNPDLRQLIARVAGQDEGLASVLAWILRRTIHGDYDKFRRATAAREQRARGMLERVLTLDIQQYPVAEPLAEMLAAWLEVEELGDAAETWRRRNVLTICRRALERLFREVAVRWPLAGVADRLSRDGEVNRARLEAAAAAIGLVEVPEGLLRVTQGQVRSVIEFGDSWRLQPLVAATLLRAVDEGDHPLLLAAAKAPDLLSRIARVAAHGGEAVHDADKPCFDLAAIASCIDTTVAVVGLLLGLPTRSIHEVYSDE